jgi:hypothetical protein
MTTTATTHARKHPSGGHGLPLSNGWTRSSDHGFTVYCGRCKDHFAGDEDWARRSLDEAARNASQRAANEVGAARMDVRDHLAALIKAGLLPADTPTPVLAAHGWTDNQSGV